MKHHLAGRWRLYAVYALALIIGGELIVLFSPGLSTIWKGSNLPLEAYAKRVLAACKDAEYRPSCYDREIPKLMDDISMEDAFKVTWLVQEEDGEYHYCHVLGHALSAKEVKKDPSKWKEVVSRCPSGMCSNGCIHGGFQERFRTDHLTDAQVNDIKGDLKIICEDRPNWHPTGLEQASCYHALGHLTMYLTAGDIAKSLALCADIAIKEDKRDFSQLCFDGAFMQIFQPLEPEDFALVKGKQPTKEQLPAFCDAYQGKHRASCLSESWPLFFDELQTPKGLVDFCSRTQPEERNRCYSALFYVLTAQFKFEIPPIRDYCTGLPQEVKGLCFANAASRMIETDYRNIDKAEQLCNEAKAQGVDTQCYDELLFYSSYNFHPQSAEFLHLCNGLPEPWRSKCLKGS